jgi:hypothetical protein
MFVKILGLLALIAGSKGQVVDCGSATSLFTINSQDFQPNPPVLGENATLWIDYTVPDGISIDSGTAKYSITLNGIPFPATKNDLCTQITCPQLPGIYNLTSASIWDGGVSGKIITTIQWYDSAGTELLCSKTTVRV